MDANEYAETLAWLYALEAARGMDFKLDRVALALKSFGDPHRRYPCIHVAGTNGKGSVSAMIHSVYTAAGYRAGMYVSPHLVTFTERIRIGADLITEDEVVNLSKRIRTAVTSHGIELTFFEFVTVMAFLHFAEEDVDVAVVEVGLGGRLDATNVITPLVSVITSIDLDHEEYLGNQIQSIAAEKCGIVKGGVPVVVGKVQASAAAVIREICRARAAPLFEANADFALSASAGGHFTGMDREITDISLALRGRFQIDNAAVAIAAVVVTASKLPVSDDQIRNALATVEWPGRFEVASGEPMIIVDGAHNPAAIRRIVAELPAVVEDRAVHLLFAVMRDKDWDSMIEALLPHLKTVTLTRALPDRSEDPRRLAATIGSRVPVRIDDDPESAFDKLLNEVEAHAAVLVTGSLFLVGSVYPAFARRRQQLRRRAAPK